MKRIGLWTLCAPERPLIRRAVAWKVLEAVVTPVPFVLVYLALMAMLEGSPEARGLTSLRGAGMLLAIMAACALAQWWCALRATHAGYAAGYRMTARLRVQLADHLRHMPMDRLRAYHSGDVAAALMQDLTAIEPIPGMVLPRLVAAVALPAIAVVMLVFVDLRLALALIASLPLAAWVLVVGRRRMAAATAQRSARLTALNTRVLEFAQGVDTLKRHCRAGGLPPRYAQALTDFRDVSRRLTAAFVAPAIAFPMVLAAGACAGLAVAVHGLLGGTLSSPVLVLFVLLSVRLFTPLYELLDFTALFEQMRVSLDRIQRLLAEPVRHVPKAGAKPHGFAVRCRGLGLALSGRTVLEGIDVDIPEGATVALVGPSGAGKSSLLRCLSGYRPPTHGTVELGGVALEDIDEASRLAAFTIVSQEVFLFSLSVADNLRLARPEATDDDLRAAARAARAHGFIANLPQGYDTVLDAQGARLSGGERQRLALARAFLKSSPIVLLDECTAALDVENERLVQEALSDLTRGKTVIAVAHRLWTVRDADQILVMDEGRIVERGDHDSLMAAGGRYAELWRQLARSPGWGARAAA